ncbi:ribosomal-protein-alanine N-acetyltransferase [Candidatus Poribacteria bacterium]|nr:ribosomal-protein-alanine N-acetyltransferase [Candidatus Poribacteria bacterium]
MKKEIDIEFDYIRESDLKDVVRIEKISFKNPWRENAFKREIENDNDFSHFIVARHKNRTIAFIGFTHVLDEAHILTFAVHPKFRRCGVGTQLLTYTLNMAKSLNTKKVTLEVRISNIPAQSLYKKFGFQIVAIRRNFYPDGEDGYIMCIPNINEVCYANNGYFKKLPERRKKDGHVSNFFKN